jgi:hypothetical protein
LSGWNPGRRVKGVPLRLGDSQAGDLPALPSDRAAAAESFGKMNDTQPAFLAASLTCLAAILLLLGNEDFAGADMDVALRKGDLDAGLLQGAK